MHPAQRRDRNRHRDRGGDRALARAHGTNGRPSGRLRAGPGTAAALRRHERPAVHRRFPARPEHRRGAVLRARGAPPGNRRGRRSPLGDRPASPGGDPRAGVGVDRGDRARAGCRTASAASARLRIAGPLRRRDEGQERACDGPRASARHDDDRRRGHGPGGRAARPDPRWTRGVRRRSRRAVPRPGAVGAPLGELSGTRANALDPAAMRARLADLLAATARSRGARRP